MFYNILIQHIYCWYHFVLIRSSRPRRQSLRTPCKMCNSILFCRLWYLQQRKVGIHLKQPDDVLISLVSLYAYILKLGMAQFVPQLSSEYRELMQLLCVATTTNIVYL